MEDKDVVKRMTLAQLRKKVGMTQGQVGVKMGMTQSEVSKIERRKDVHVSTLRQYLKALDGNLEIFIVFPNEDSEAIKL